MNGLGSKIAGKRKDMGITQQEFADMLSVTRQTVSRWEAGTVFPDIEKIADIAKTLNVSCDYLLRDDIEEDELRTAKGPGPVIRALKGKQVRIMFADEMADIDLFNSVCTVEDFEGNWIKLSADTKNGHIEKLLPLAYIATFEIVGEEK
ncbi:MAG: helix-turn-helix domain-containing protein [Firmicutes bacterium]|nr:helix-turn-helix domain-containing protein [Bacillota bacterium]